MCVIFNDVLNKGLRIFLIVWSSNVFIDDLEDFFLVCFLIFLKFILRRNVLKKEEIYFRFFNKVFSWDEDFFFFLIKVIFVKDDIFVR